MATPICDGDIPFFAIVTINYVIDLGVWATHLAHLLLNGVTVELIPFPFPLDWILPIINVDFYKNINLIKYSFFSFFYAFKCFYIKIRIFSFDFKQFIIYEHLFCHKFLKEDVNLVKFYEY